MYKQTKHIAQNLMSANNKMKTGEKKSIERKREGEQTEITATVIVVVVVADNNILVVAKNCWQWRSSAQQLSKKSKQILTCECIHNKLTWNRSRTNAKWFACANTVCAHVKIKWKLIVCVCVRVCILFVLSYANGISDQIKASHIYIYIQKTQHINDMRLFTY